MERIILSLVLMVCVIKCSPVSHDEIEDFSNFLENTAQLDLHVKSADPNHSFDEDEEVSDHAWEESGKFEGDLILNERQRRLVVENVVGLSRNGLKDSTKRWPNNEVIYFIQREHFDSDQVQAIKDGIDDLARASCVKFRPYVKGDRDAVVIQGSRRGCFSQVGYQSGYQVLNLSGRHPVGRGCFRHGTVIHELLHTLGFYHMQSSPDRDDYINVIWENIVQPARHNFRKYNSFAVSDFGIEYDYDSVLHYSRRAFSANGQDTLVPKKRGAEIGQRVGLSDKDTQKLNKMYCDADSNNFEAEEDTTEKPKSKGKSPKNKPFDGHGIGYHQGKTVVIKLLPAAETYKLADVPSFHLFDYFSKTPQAVSTTETKGLGQEVVYSYNPPSTSTEEQRKPIITMSNTVDQSKDSKTNPLDLSGDHHNNEEIIKVPINEKDEGKSIVLESLNDSSLDIKKPENESMIHEDDSSDAFDKLENIIKQNLYPSQSPYLTTYRINNAYIKFYNPSSETKINDDSSYQLPQKELEYETNKSKAPQSSILENRNDQRPYVSDENDQGENHVSGLITESPHDEEQALSIRDSSYRTTVPLNMNSDEGKHIVIPDYVSNGHIKQINNYSGLYYPQIKDDLRWKRPHNLYVDELPLTDDEWYRKDFLEHSPAKYNLNYYIDYLSDSKNHDPDIDKIQNRKSYRDYEGENASTLPLATSLASQAYSLFGIQSTWAT